MSCNVVHEAPPNKEAKLPARRAAVRLDDDESVAAACGVDSARRRPPPPQVPPGKLVDLDAHRLWLSCDGQGSPTIFVEVGGGSNGGDWWNAVAEPRRDTRVCICSRAGCPRNDEGPMPREAGREADEAAALIQRARVERPFLLVAHSLGAMNALALANRHPDWLIGMVRMDPPPLSWMASRTFANIRTDVVASVARMRGTAARLRARPGRPARRPTRAE